jgi:hypothetical protein
VRRAPGLSAGLRLGRKPEVGKVMSPSTWRLRWQSQDGEL